MRRAQSRLNQSITGAGAMTPKQKLSGRNWRWTAGGAICGLHYVELPSALRNDAVLHHGTHQVILNWYRFVTLLLVPRAALT